MNELHREKEASETFTTAQSSDRSMVLTICPFCSVRYKSYISLLNKPTRCHSCYLKFLANESLDKGTITRDKATQTSFSTTEKSVSTQNHVSRSSFVAATTKNQVKPQTAPSSLSPRICAMCPSCKLKYRFPIRWTNKWFVCKCQKRFKTVEVSSSSLQQKTVASKNQATRFSGKESSPGLSCAVEVGEKRKRNECGEVTMLETAVLYITTKELLQVHVVDRSTTEDPMSNAINLNPKVDENQDAQVGAVVGNSGDLDVDKNSEDVVDNAVDNNRRGFNGIGDAGRQEESGKQLHEVTGDNGDAREDSESGKQVHVVDPSTTADPMSKNAINLNQKMDRNQDAQVGASVVNSGDLDVDKNSENVVDNAVENNHLGLCDSVPGYAIQPKTSECGGLKFNDFNKLREDAKFSECQAWTLYDKADGMPRQYAVVRKVSPPSFGLRITYLEPDPEDEKEIQWFEEDLPVSVGNFRFGKNQNTKDRSMFSHVICCQGSIMTGNFTVSPRKGETWAIFKNWDMNWSSDTDSHRKYEYDIVEVLSNTTDGVSVAILYKAKGFASVFFRMDAEVIQIPSHSLYRFSHSIPSFKMKRVDVKGVPKDAYELDQAALPKAATMEEKVVPCHLYAEPKPEALNFPNKGKVFQTGQIWSFYSGGDTLPLYYCRIQKITLIQAFEQETVFKLHVGRLKAKPFPEEIIQWEDSRRPVGCGTFLVRKINDVLTADDVSHQIVPQTSLDGSEYTILPKIGEVWAIYRCCDYDIVEVLDDTLGYKVLALEHVLSSNEDEEKKTLFGAAESRHHDCGDEDGTEAIFTIPESKILRFSHQIPASRITKEIQGDFKELFEVDSRALPTKVGGGFKTIEQRSDLVSSSTPKNQQENAQVFNNNSATQCSGNKSSSGEKRKRSITESCSAEQNNRRGSSAERGEELTQTESSDPKFNDFDKLREKANFAVGQTWALYDTADKMPRLYAKIRRVLAPSFGLRITYLEPDPDNEKEIQWFEQDLPVSAGKFRLGSSENIKDRSRFSHPIQIQCNEGGSNSGHLTVSPRKGETWALFKNWDITKWSSEPDSHRSYEYEFVEILSDYVDGAGVYVSYLHKAKGFVSVFFRVGTGPEDVLRILPHSLYRFSHRIPSFKLTGTEGKSMPKDAYELDKSALPKAIVETILPSNSESESESNRKRKGQAIYFARKGKVFKTGQIWSFYSGYDDLPLHYGKIQKITFTQVLGQEPVLKLHISRLKKATPFPKDVMDWEDGKMPLGCGTYYPRTVLEIITPDVVSHQVMTPQISLDGKEYTILPKTGEVWVIYRYWRRDIESERLDYCTYNIVQVLDDALEYKVLLLGRESGHDEGDFYENSWFKEVTEYQDYDDDGSEPIFTIPKSERLRFSHMVPASRVTKETFGELEDLYKVETRALPINLLGH
ncbi:hypothetical protein Bca101_016547 [Brassica carinata]